MMASIGNIFMIFELICCLSIITVCGATSQNNETTNPLEPRIIGGSPIDITQAPYQVSLRLKSAEKKYFGAGHLCGGSVITQRVIISAAHCIAISGTNPLAFRVPSDFMVVMGSMYLYKVNQYTRRFNVIDIRHHTGFRMDTLQNDIAMIFIDGFIPYNFPTVKPIPLNRVAEQAGTGCIVSGWGTTSESGEVSAQLLAVSVPIVDSRSCSRFYENITSGKLCAGYLSTGGADACQGDSGGPLRCHGVLTGIVSYGYGCGRPLFVGVYANVSDYYNWIVSVNSTFNYTYYQGVKDGYDGGIAGIHTQPWLLISGGLLMLIFFMDNFKH